MRKSWFLILGAVLLILSAFGVFAYFYCFKPISVSPSSSPPKEIIILALGDSLTQAANPSKELVGDHPEYSYACGEKIKSLKILFENDGYDVECENLSKSGARSDQILKEQIPNAKNLQPDLVVMTIGGNDAMQGISNDDFKENLSKIILSLPKTKILIGSIPNLEKFRENNFPSCKTPLTQYRELESLTAVYTITYNLVIKSLENEEVKMVDLFNGLNKDDVSNYDCLHFSISGQEKTAQMFWDKLK